MTISVRWEQAKTYPAATDRELISAGMAQAAVGFGPRPGVIPGASPFAATASGGMNVTIAPGQAQMASGHLFSSNASVVVTIPPASASPRIDLIIDRVYDADLGDVLPGGNPGTVEVLQGTPSASPVAPTVPAGIATRVIVLHQVAVGASVSSINSGNLTDKRTYTAAAGGIVIAAGALASTPSAIGVAVGQQVWDSISRVLLTALTATTWDIDSAQSVASAAAVPGGTPQVINLGGGNWDQTMVTVTQRAGVALRVDFTALWTAHTISANSSFVRTTAYFGVNGGALTPVPSGVANGTAPSAYAAQLTLVGFGVIPADTADRSVRVVLSSVNVGTAEPKRLDSLSTIVTPVYVVADF